MDELIILLIKGLAKMLGTGQPPKARQTPAQASSSRGVAQQPAKRGVSQRQQPRQQPQRRAAATPRRGANPARPVLQPTRPAVDTDILEVVPDFPSTAASRGAASVATAATAHRPQSVNAIAIP